jgi:hypothetical protein
VPACTREKRARPRQAHGAPEVRIGAAPPTVLRRFRPVQRRACPAGAATRGHGQAPPPSARVFRCARDGGRHGMAHMPHGPVDGEAVAGAAARDALTRGQFTRGGTGGTARVPEAATACGGAGRTTRDEPMSECYIWRGRRTTDPKSTAPEVRLLPPVSPSRKNQPPSSVHA